MTPRQYQAIINRQRRLPEQLDAARRKVRHLEAEAIRYGMHELVEARA